jgi:hypothetical protein
VISFESIQIECCILFLFSFELNIFSIRMHIQIEVLKKKFHLKFHCLTWIDSSGILIHVWLLDAKKYRRLQISLEKLIFKMAEFPIHTFESLWMPSRKDIYIVLLSIFFFFFLSLSCLEIWAKIEFTIWIKDAFTTWQHSSTWS